MEPCSERPWKFDIGIQCCFGPITLKNESTQTDCVNDAPPTANVTEVSNNDGPLPMQAEEWKIKNDHTYAMQAPPHVIFPTYEDDNFNATSPPPLHEVEVTTINDNIDGASDDESGSNYVDDDGNDDDDEDLDPSWQLADDKKLITEDDNLPSDDEFEGNSNTPDCEKKFLVFDSCLSTLLKRCPECGDVIAQCDRKTTGSMLSVHHTCHSGHMINWDSQPVVKRKPLRKPVAGSVNPLHR